MDTQENNTNTQLEQASAEEHTSAVEPAALNADPRLVALAAALNEPNIELMTRVATALGMEQVETIYQRTLAIEAAGGMLTVRGNRRRTPGGVFFFLAREGMNRAQEHAVFGDQPGGPTPPKPKLESPSAEQVRGLLALAVKVPAPQKGPSVMKATVIGRPKQIKKLSSCVMVVLGQKAPPVMPTGLPPIPDTSTATIAVFIAEKQWANVEKALRTDPKDELIAEGYPINDPKHQLTGFWAQSCTTKGIQKAKRARTIE